MNNKAQGYSHLIRFQKLLIDVANSPFTSQLLSDYISSIMGEINNVLPLWEKIIATDDGKLQMDRPLYSELTKSLSLILIQMTKIAHISGTLSVFMKLAQAEQEIEKVGKIAMSIKKNEFAHQ